MTKPFRNFHYKEDEIINEILSLWETKPTDGEFQLKHKYIDFTPIVIGTKIAKTVAQEIKSRNDLEPFNDLYYAQLIQAVDSNNVDFYLRESVQRIIDF